jgi:hypothetical protein
MSGGLELAPGRPSRTMTHAERFNGYRRSLDRWRRVETVRCRMVRGVSLRYTNSGFENGGQPLEAVLTHATDVDPSRRVVLQIGLVAVLATEY